jgi:hypothetical protein
MLARAVACLQVCPDVSDFLSWNLRRVEKAPWIVHTAHLAQCVPNVEIAMIPQSITDAVDPAGVSEMCLKHVIT